MEDKIRIISFFLDSLKNIIKRTSKIEEKLN